MLVKRKYMSVARSLVAVFAVFFSLFFPDLAVAMPRKMWPAEAEKFLIEEWHNVLKSTQGVMMTKAEKVDLVLKKLNARSKENEWDLDLSTDRALEKKRFLEVDDVQTQPWEACCVRTGSQIDL